MRSIVLLSNGKVAKNVIGFGVDMSLSVDIDNENRILIFGKGLRQGLDVVMLTTEAQYSINFSSLLHLRQKFSILTTSVKIQFNYLFCFI